MQRRFCFHAHTPFLVARVFAWSNVTTEEGVYKVVEFGPELREA